MINYQKGIAHILLLIVLILLASVGVGYWGYTYKQTKLIPPPIRTETRFLSPTPITEPTRLPANLPGYVGYNLDGKRFTLSLPEECQEQDRDVNENHPDRFYITCIKEGFKVGINPQEGGRGLGEYQPLDVLTGKIKIDEYLWDYTIWIDEDGSAFSSYSFTDPETNDYYLISGHYFPYSESARNYFDQILSTFKFIE